VQLFGKIRGKPNFGEDNLLAIKLLLALGMRKGELPGVRLPQGATTSFRSDAATPASGYRAATILAFSAAEGR
jgi:hypothetical protein